MGVNVMILYLLVKWDVESVWLFEYLMFFLGFNMEKLKGFEVIMFFVLYYGFLLFFKVGSVVLLLVIMCIVVVLDLF